MLSSSNGWAFDIGTPSSPVPLHYNGTAWAPVPTPSSWARSDQSAAALSAAGAAVQRGALDDLDSLRAGAAAAEGVIHLAFMYDFSNFDDALTTDLHVVETTGVALEGSGKPFVITGHRNGEASENVVIALAERGVRTCSGWFWKLLRQGRGGAGPAGRRSLAVNLRWAIVGVGDGDIITLKLGRSRRVPVSALQAFIARQLREQGA